MIVRSSRCCHSCGSTSIQLPRSFTVSACEAFWRMVMCSNQNISRMPVSAKMRANSFIFPRAMLCASRTACSPMFCKCIRVESLALPGDAGAPLTLPVHVFDGREDEIAPIG